MRLRSISVSCETQRMYRIGTMEAIARAAACFPDFPSLHVEMGVCGCIKLSRLGPTPELSEWPNMPPEARVH